MMRDIKKGQVDTILIHKYDRIARNVAEHVNLETKLKALDIQLIATDQDFGSSKEAKIMRMLSWAMSEYYIDNLAGETQKGHKVNAQKALHNGGYPPFGYDVVDRKYVVNELEAAYVRKIFEAARQRKGFKDLIAEMQAAGVRGKRGAVIRYPQIYEILCNERYTGVYLYSPEQEVKRGDRRRKPNAIRIEGGMPQLISQALFQEVQEIMRSRKQTGARGGYLCSGLVYCGHCGAKMHATTTHKKGYTYPIYYCSASCGIGTVKIDDIDGTVKSYLHDLLSDDNKAKIASALRRYISTERDRVAEFNANIKKQLADKQSQYDAYLAQLGTGVLPPEIVSDIGKKMQQIKEEMSVLQTAEPPYDGTPDQIVAWLTSLEQSEGDETVQLLVEKIVVAKENEKTAVNVSSTLTAVLGNNGCGGRI